MFKKCLMSVLFVFIFSAYVFSGAVPAKPARTSGMVKDAQAKVHLGQMYRTGHFYTAVSSFVPNNFAVFLIDVATNTFTSDSIHGTLTVVAKGSSIIRMYANPVISSSGTVVDSYNLNQQIADSAEAIFFHTPTVTSSGTVISPDIYVPAGVVFNSDQWFKDGSEFLGADVGYLITVENNSTADSDIGIYSDFYEAIDP